jgi:hypothetical protein
VPHRHDILRRAGVDTACRKTVERRDDLSDASFGERDRALAGCRNLFDTLALDQARNPIVERKQRPARQQGARHHGNNVLTR